MIDTPGYADFVSDVAAALRAADLAVFVVSAVEGVEVQTEIVWRMADELGLPRAIFVNKLDRERASFARTLDQLKDKFGAGVAPLQLPIGEEADFRGVVELLDDHAVHYVDGAARHEGPDPARDGDGGALDPRRARRGHRRRRRRPHGALPRRRDHPTSELAHALADGIASGAVFPVLCGSATKLIGVDRLATFIVEEGPAPHGAAGDGPPVAFVFKTIVDPYVGHVNLFKVLQGTVKADATLVNGRTMHDERLHQLSSCAARSRSRSSEVPAGDIAAVAKLADTTTGDVLGARGADIDVEPFAPPAPVLAVAIHAKSKSDEDKLANALHRLLDEDPSLRLERNAETHQTLLWGHGRDPPRHRARAARGASSASRSRPKTCRVAYRETITARRPRPRASTRSRPAATGSSAVAFLRVEPLERGGRLRVRRQDRRRRDPPPVHPRGREGRARDRWSTAGCSASPSST